MHIQRHTHTSTNVQSAHQRNGDNQAQEPGWERRKKGFVRDLAHTHAQKKQKNVRKKPTFTNLKERFEHIELPAKLLDYFFRNNKSNINQNLKSEAWCVYTAAEFYEREGLESCDSALTLTCWRCNVLLLLSSAIDVGHGCFTPWTKELVAYTRLLPYSMTLSLWQPESPSPS